MSIYIVFPPTTLLSPETTSLLLVYPAIMSVAATEKRPEIIEIARGLNHVPMCEDYERMISGML